MNKYKLIIGAIAVSLIPSAALADCKVNYPHLLRPRDYHSHNVYSHYNNVSYGSGHYYGHGNGFWGGNFDKHIRNGMRSGRLTRNEVQDLRSDQWEIRKKQAAYYADGYLSKYERRDLVGEIKDFRKDLKHNLNDGERR